VKQIDLLWTGATRVPDKIACMSADAKISYGQLIGCVDRLAARLKDMGCREGISAAIVLNNSVEYLISLFAISAAGGTVCPLFGRMTKNEIHRCLAQGNVSLVITNREMRTKLVEEEDAYRLAGICYVKYTRGNDLDVDIETHEFCQPDEELLDVALLLPTSGTTGRPKMVMLTHDNVISNVLAYRSAMGFSGQDTSYCTLPMNHIYSLNAQILTHISLGDTLVISDCPFLTQDFFKSVEEHRVTVTSFVPFMGILMAECHQPEQFDLGSLKCITFAGSKTPEPVYEELATKYPDMRFVGTYGMTEAGPRISVAAPLDQEYALGSAGRPMSGVQVNITDEMGNETDIGITGEIRIKGRGVMKGYYRQRELTLETLVDGWLRTGDLGHFDRDGNLFVDGRIKDIIVSGGRNVYPTEIEECLLKHPSIRQAVVVGRSDRLLQEVPHVFVVARPNSGNIRAADIIRFCRHQLSSYKVPRAVRIVERLPMLTNSKIDRNALKAMVEEIH